MYEDLINKLRYCGNAVSCIHCPYWEGCAGSKEDMIEAADAIEELICEVADEHNARLDAEERQRWIPEAEKLPEIGKKVLVFAYGHDTLTARMQKRTEFGYPMFECNGVYLELAKQGRITHWMPLPEAPKEE